MSGKTAVTVRPARAADADAMGELLVNTWLHAHADHVPAVVLAQRRREWTPAVSALAWRRSLTEIDQARQRAGPPAQAILLAVTDAPGSAPVGMTMATLTTDDTVDMLVLYVDRHWQGRGVGSTLLAAVVAHELAQSARYLELAVLAQNAPARRFYDALGGAVVGAAKVDDGGVWLPEVIYRWRLTALRKALSLRGVAC